MFVIEHCSLLNFVYEIFWNSRFLAAPLIYLFFSFCLFAAKYYFLLFSFFFLRFKISLKWCIQEQIEVSTHSATTTKCNGICQKKKKKCLLPSIWFRCHLAHTMFCGWCGLVSMLKWTQNSAICSAFFVSQWIGRWAADE